MSILTMKFGGTSVGSIEAIQNVASIIQSKREDGHKVATVVSAMSGVTNSLIHAAKASENGDVSTYRRVAHELRTRHIETATALVSVANRRMRLHDEIRALLDDFEQLCHSIAIMREVTPRGMDVVSSLGERLSVRLVAAHLEEIGVSSQAIEASSLIITNDRFQNATPDMEATRAKVQSKLLPLLERGVSPVITGFLGATPNGTITTLGRGGSDYSGGIIAACLPADELWIWTDVDGVMTTDPRVTDKARTISVLGYSEVGEMAYFGAKVLHPRTIVPVMDLAMPIRVANTFNAAHPGTLIKAEPEITAGAIKAVTTISDVHMMTVKGRGMVGVPGIAGRTFTAVAASDTNMLMFAQSSSEQSFCFIVPANMSSAAKASIQAELAIEIGREDVDEVEIAEDVAILTCIGAGMRDTPGVAANIFGQLGASGVNILAIAQGASAQTISMVVSSGDLLTAVQVLHELVQDN